ncbi:MAG: hypothetical protein GY898_26645 [Proteobacteria bacterium]|nr:hypothetical protein [Pseudomonadota bacterium]
MSITKVSISRNDDVYLSGGKGEEAHGVLEVTGRATKSFEANVKYAIKGEPNYKKSGTFIRSNGSVHQFKVD